MAPKAWPSPGAQASRRRALSAMSCLSAMPLPSGSARPVL